MEQTKKDQAVWTLTLIATIFLLGLLLWALWVSGFFAARSSAEMQTYIEHFSPYSHVVFFLLQLSSVILAPIPSNVTAAVGGLLFGTLVSFLLTAGAVTLGSVIVFQLSRSLGRTFAERFVSRRDWDKYTEVFRRKRDTFLFLAFLFPFFPDDILCILAGLTDIPFRRFFLLVLLTRPWGLLVACALGGSAIHIPPWCMALLGVAGLCVFLLAMKYGERLEEAILKKLKK